MAAMGYGSGSLEVEVDCTLCQEKVVAKRDGGVHTGRLYCTQCGEEVVLRAAAGAGGTGGRDIARIMAGLAGARDAADGAGDGNDGNVTGSVARDDEGGGTDADANHSAMAAMLDQALIRGAGETEDVDAAAGVAVPSHLRNVFQMLLPAFQRFMSGAGVGEGDIDPSMFGLGEVGFGGGGGGGAPPAAKLAVEQLERVVLDADNLKAQTSRITLRWGRLEVTEAAVADATGDTKDGDGTALVQLKRDHGSGTMYAEQAEFGPSFVDEPIMSPPRALGLAQPLECHVEPPASARGEGAEEGSAQNDYAGKVVVCRRGKCSFALKVLRAQDAGAAAVVVVNSVETPWPFTMGDSKGEACGAGAARGRKITIPSAMIRKRHGDVLIQALKATRGGGETDGGAASAGSGLAVEIRPDTGCETCAVCQNDFGAGDECLRMPCEGRHLFHVDCIMPWLKMRNSCPSCRYELPTDNQAYDTARARERAQVTAGQAFWDTSVS